MKTPELINRSCIPFRCKKSLIQRGRSMIEMLGVLAFVGMLSVVSVYVFQKAMTKNRTNQLVEDMRLAGMVVLDGLYDKLATYEKPIKGQFEQQTPYIFTAALEEDSLNNFVVIADGVPFDVCVAVKDRKPNWAETIAVNGLEDVCHETENNFVSFFFNNELTDLLHDYCENNSDCGECGECNDNKCSYGFKNTSGKCYSCNVANMSNYNERSIRNISKEECHKCSNRMYSTFNGERCVSVLDHDMNYWNNVPKEDCEKFPNQYSASDGGICFYCSGSFDPTTGVCSTTDCYRNSNGTYIFGLDKDTCEQCGGIYGKTKTADGFVGRCSREGGWTLE